MLKSSGIDAIQETFRGVDCILAFETASDYIGTNTGCDHRPDFSVYAKEELNIPDVECIIVNSFDGIDTEELGGIRATSATRTLNDLLRYDRDPQVIVEAVADWYYSHNDSFDDLVIDEDLKAEFNDYIEDALNYYKY